MRNSIAYAARLFGAPALIYMPEGANPLKVAATKALGAEVVLSGRDFDSARDAAEDRAKQDGLRYVHSANEPDLIAGVATAALELLESEPDLNMIVVPVGGGSGVLGAGLVAARSIHASESSAFRRKPRRDLSLLEGGPRRRDRNRRDLRRRFGHAQTL